MPHDDRRKKKERNKNHAQWAVKNKNKIGPGAYMSTGGVKGWGGGPPEPQKLTQGPLACEAQN